MEQEYDHQKMLESIPEPYRSACKDSGPGNDHKNRIMVSVLVGCYYCLEIFRPAEIEEWTADGCALCPKCGIDSVLPEADGKYAADFLKWMRFHWFEHTVPLGV
jgi:hypothetical protein